MKTIITIIAVICCFQIAQSQTWVQKLNGIGMWSLAKDYSGNIYAGASGTVKSIYKSTDGGNNWTEVFSSGVSNFLYLACDSSAGVYASYSTNGVLKSTNGGLNWIVIPSGTFNNKTVNAVACGKNGYVYVGCTNGGVFRSTDYGATFPDNPVNTLTIVTIAVDRFNSNIIYAGASSATPPNYGFYRSTDAGLTFSNDLLSLNIWGIAQKANGSLYAVTTTSAYPFSKSTNGGLNWLTTTYLGGAMRGLCLDLSENIFTAGNGGVFKSTNDGGLFTSFGFTNSSNHIISFQNKILVCASGTSNGGVWIYSDSLLGINEPANTIPENFVLYQNYPNPFNPSTKIKFDLPKSNLTLSGVEGSNVKIIITDILGREIASLIPPLRGGQEGLQAGTYEVEWYAGNYPSGVYFYKIETDNFSQTRKMILIK
jgi:hypothetical protein